MEDFITVKAISEMTNVPERTVHNAIDRAFPYIKKNGIKTIIGRFEAQVIIEELKKSHNSELASSGKVITTDLEMLQKAQDFMAWATIKIQEETQKRIDAESRTNRLIHNSTTYTTSEIAKELNMVSPQELNSKLRDKGIQHKDARNVWLLNAEYSGKGFQNIKQGEKNGHIIYYSEWTGIGRDWIIGMFSKDVK